MGGVYLTIHPHLVTELRMGEFLPPLPQSQILFKNIRNLTV